MRFSTEGLARACSSHPWRTIAVWLAVIVLSFGAVGAFLSDALSGGEEVTSETESRRANGLIARHFPLTHEEVENEISEVVVVRWSVEPLGVDQEFSERVEQLADDLRAAGAARVVPGGPGGGGGSASLLVAPGLDAEETTPRIMEEVERLDAELGIEAAVTGEWTVDEDFGTLAQDDLRNGEIFFGAPAALIILLLVFGAVVAGLIPLILALMSILVAVALTALVGQIWPLSEFVTNMIFGMGLALGIDYTLFIISRYREERSEGREKLEAIAAAGGTASRAVLFSGIAFVLSMLGLLLVPNTIMRSLAAGAILVGITSMAAALTLTPALLGLLGDRVNALRLPYFGRAAEAGAEQGSRFWDRVVQAVLRRPVASLVLATALLLAAAVPVLALETGTAGVSTMPDRFTSKRGFTLLNEEFPGQTTDPVVIALEGNADSPGVQEAVNRLEAALARNDLFGPPQQDTSEDGRLTRLTVPISGDSTSTGAIEAVRDLRSEAPRSALVTGDTAEELDYHDVMSSWMLPVFIFVLGLSFILLTVAFRSIVLPAKAILLNLLSVGAAYGLLILVFVEGYGNELFGFQQVDTVEAWVPLFLFAVLFGLSMDYQVFLLSRIRERFSRTGSNDDAIAFGVGSTARLITGAALIIIAVFAGFARGDLVMFQQMGFGVAVALLLDATIVRSVLVPASMKLLGRWNWYLPSWLSWLPDVHVEGSEPRRAGR